MDASKLNRTLFIRDNLEVLRGIQDKSVDLIYLDPPFNSNKNYGVPIGGKQAGFHFKDMWTLGDNKEEWYGELSDNYQGLYEVIHAVGCINGNKHKAYLIYMAIRLIEMYRVLKDTGSIYLHCDQTMSHSLKLIMDAIFNKKNFINEIIWRRASERSKIQHQNGVRSLGRGTDIILHYTKSKKYIFHSVYKKLSQEEITEKFPKIEQNGRKYNTNTPIFCSSSMGSRPNQCYEYKGIKPPHQGGWRFTKKRLIEEDKKGNIIWRENKTPQRKSYADEYKGKPIGNLWVDIDYAPQAERTNYSTQKQRPY